MLEKSVCCKGELCGCEVWGGIREGVGVRVYSSLSLKLKVEDVKWGVISLLGM